MSWRGSRGDVIRKVVQSCHALPITASLLLLGPDSARSEFATLDLKPVPIERLLANVKSYVQNHPNESWGFYVLGRLHSMAYAGGSGAWKADTNRSLPALDPNIPEFIQPDERRQGTEAEIRSHLLESLRNYRRAVELAPKAPHYHLGLGWMLEQGSPLVGRGLVVLPPWYDPEPLVAKARPASSIGTAVTQIGKASQAEWDAIYSQLSKKPDKVLPELIRVQRNPDSSAKRNVDRLLSEFWVDEALRSYRMALSQCGSDHCSFFYDEPPSGYEAGKAIIRIQELRLKQGRGDRKEIDRAKKMLKEIESRPRAITPLIFASHKVAPLDQLRDPDAKVGFDLAGGMGVPTRWDWVSPRASFLAWDPFGTGKVESGLQLFGSVTWWIFWQDGYQSLAALDDDGDGWLTGEELIGIVAWTDRNQDGISQPDEVRPLDEVGVVAVAVTGANNCDGTKCNPRGIRFSDGRFGATYDWIATPSSK